MNKFLHISFTFNEGIPKVQELEPLFNALAPDWIRYSPNCWIVWTARPASDFLYAIKPLIGQSDSVLMVKIDMSERNGWQPQWVWEWMDKKRQLGPPPPPLPPSPDLASMFGSLAPPPNPSPHYNALLEFQKRPKG
jgi:hypothetical protein